MQVTTSTQMPADMLWHWNNPFGSVWLLRRHLSIFHRYMKRGHPKEQHSFCQVVGGCFPLVSLFWGSESFLFADAREDTADSFISIPGLSVRKRLKHLSASSDVSYSLHQQNARACHCRLYPIRTLVFHLLPMPFISSFLLRCGSLIKLVLLHVVLSLLTSAAQTSNHGSVLPNPSGPSAPGLCVHRLQLLPRAVEAATFSPEPSLSRCPPPALSCAHAGGLGSAVPMQREKMLSHLALYTFYRFVEENPVS